MFYDAFSPAFSAAPACPLDISRAILCVRATDIPPTFGCLSSCSEKNSKPKTINIYIHPRAQKKRRNTYDRTISRPDFRESFCTNKRIPAMDEIAAKHPT
jgi:hypothetical protein